MLHVSDVAQMQFPGGGRVMPADSPYDRQLLRELVPTLVQGGDTLQLRLDENEWIVTRLSGAGRSCTACAQPLRVLRCRRENDPTALCIECVLRPQLNDDVSGG